MLKSNLDTINVALINVGAIVQSEKETKNIERQRGTNREGEWD
jgi:hypothetical protein